MSFRRRRRGITHSKEYQTAWRYGWELKSISELTKSHGAINGNSFQGLIDGMTAKRKAAP